MANCRRSDLWFSSGHKLFQSFVDIGVASVVWLVVAMAARARSLSMTRVRVRVDLILLLICQKRDTRALHERV
jgi:hypothetical protein